MSKKKHIRNLRKLDGYRASSGEGEGSLDGCGWPTSDRGTTSYCCPLLVLAPSLGRNRLAARTSTAEDARRTMLECTGLSKAKVDPALRVRYTVPRMRPLEACQTGSCGMVCSLTYLTESALALSIPRFYAPSSSCRTAAGPAPSVARGNTAEATLAQDGETVRLRGCDAEQRYAWLSRAVVSATSRAVEQRGSSAAQPRSTAPGQATGPSRPARQGSACVELNFSAKSIQKIYSRRHFAFVA